MTLVFEDDGIGIADADKKMIFEWGYKNRMGHGLHFVSEMLAITGLSIKETGQYGKGARFEVFVPKGSFRIVPVEVPPVQQEEANEPIIPAEDSESQVVFRSTV